MLLRRLQAFAAYTFKSISIKTGRDPSLLTSNLYTLMRQQKAVKTAPGKPAFSFSSGMDRTLLVLRALSVCKHDGVNLGRPVQQHMENVTSSRVEQIAVHFVMLIYRYLLIFRAFTDTCDRITHSTPYKLCYHILNLLQSTELGKKP